MLDKAYYVLAAIIIVENAALMIVHGGIWAVMGFVWIMFWAQLAIQDWHNHLLRKTERLHQESLQISRPSEEWNEGKGL